MIDLKGITPTTAPCSECMAEAATSQEHGNAVVFVYCFHNRAGSILIQTKTGGMWSTYSLISEEEFMGIVGNISKTYLTHTEEEANQSPHKH